VLTSGTVWVAEATGGIIGFAALRGDVLDHLYVHPEAGDQRVGTRLLDAVRASAMDRLALYVFQRNVRARRSDFVAALTAHVKQGDRIRMSGLGILEVKTRAARMGRNPATGEAIRIKASKKVAFRAAKELKEAV
jgi:DNA-binding protein HU-beta